MMFIVILCYFVNQWGNNEANSTSNEQHFDQDLVIIQREKSKMSAKDQAKLMNILKANFDEYNWDEDDSGDIE
mgnify:CR=1 FL=1